MTFSRLTYRYVNRESLVQNRFDKLNVNSTHHPLLKPRGSWATDIFRDVQSMGYYVNPFVPTTGQASGLNTVQHHNRNAIAADIAAGTDWNGGFSSIYNSDSPVPYNLEIMSQDDFRGLNLVATEQSLQNDQQIVLDEVAVKLRPNSTSWNSVLDSGSNMQYFLSQEGAGTIFSGQPYFVDYTEAGIPCPDGGRIDANCPDTAYAGIFNSSTGVPDYPDPSAPAYDHTFTMKTGYAYDTPAGGGAPTIKTDRNLPDDDVNPMPNRSILVEGVYNHFFDTHPDYEAVIMNLAEAQLPNFYMLESTFASEGSSEDRDFPYLGGRSGPEAAGGNPMGLGFDYTDSVISTSSDQAPAAFFQYKLIPAFENYYAKLAQPTTGLGQHRGFYEYYTEFVDLLNKSGRLPRTRDNMNENYRDIAVLYGDEGVLNGSQQGINLVRDDRGTPDPTDDIMAIDYYPFYNKITVPRFTPSDGIFHDVCNFYGMPDNWWEEFNSLGAVKRYINFLQLAVCNNLSSPAPAPILVPDEYATIHCARSLGDTPGWGTILSDADQSMHLPAVLNLEELILKSSRQNYPGTPGADESLVRLLMGLYMFGEWDDNPNFQPNFIPLREAFCPRYSTFPEDSTTAAWSEIGPGSFPTTLAMRMREKARTLQEVWDGTEAHSETFMYVVEKRVVPAGQLSANMSVDPVQKFYFTPDYNTEGYSTLEYIDTQIKYGVKYQYDLKEVKLVVGNQYYYDQINTYITEDVGYGRAIANALGFYREEADWAWESSLEDKLKTDRADVFGPTSWPDRTYTAESADVLNEVHEHNAGSSITGYYIYKLPEGTFINDILGDNDNDYIINAWLDLGVGGSTGGMSEVIEVNVNWSLLNLIPEPGFGFGGNETGGAVGAPPGDPPMLGIGGGETEDTLDSAPWLVWGGDQEWWSTAGDIATQQTETDAGVNIGGIGQVLDFGVSLDVTNSIAVIEGLLGALIADEVLDMVDIGGLLPSTLIDALTSVGALGGMGPELGGFGGVFDRDTGDDDDTWLGAGGGAGGGTGTGTGSGDDDDGDESGGAGDEGDGDESGGDDGGTWDPSAWPSGGGTCVVKGTYIDTDEGKILVEDITVDTKVLSHDFKTSEMGYFKVLGTVSNTVDGWCKIKTKGGLVLGCSLDHPIMSKSAKLLELVASEASPGDHTWVLKGGKLEDDIIESVEIFEGLVEVCNMEVDNVHTYISDGILSHNMAVKKGGGGGGGWPEDDDENNILNLQIDVATALRNIDAISDQSFAGVMFEISFGTALGTNRGGNSGGGPAGSGGGYQGGPN